MAEIVFIFLLLITTSVVFQLSTAIESFGECETPHQENGTCIKLTDCKVLLDLVIHSSSTEDVNFLRNSQCGFINKTVLICCPSKYIGNQTLSSEFPSSVKKSSTANLLPSFPHCGKLPSSRIPVGTFTEIDEHTWMALLIYTNSQNENHSYCAGSLINNRYVLTASHCIFGVPNAWNLTGIRLGEWDTTTKLDCEYDIRGKGDCSDEHIDYGIEEIITHPEYSAKNNDIALVRLDDNVKYSVFIQPICLPIDPQLQNKNYDNRLMVIAGWGETETNQASTVKWQEYVQVWPMERCQQDHRINNTQLCAGTESKVSFCRSINGGPLMFAEHINRQLGYYMAGLLSYGMDDCKIQKWQAVYTRVDLYIDWIRDNIRP